VGIKINAVNRENVNSDGKRAWEELTIGKRNENCSWKFSTESYDKYFSKKYYNS